jgi:hypothetical protein
MLSIFASFERVIMLHTLAHLSPSASSDDDIKHIEFAGKVRSPLSQPAAADPARNLLHCLCRVSWLVRAGKARD